MITRSYIKALFDGLPIKPDDSTTLINLAQKWEECSTTLEHLHYFSDLNCFENLVQVTRRLPPALQTRWLRSAAKIEEEGRGQVLTRAKVCGQGNGCSDIVVCTSNQ